MFDNIYTDNNGTITYEELKEGLAKLGSKLTEAEVKQLMDAADVDGNGSIDYIEFITATFHRHRLESNEKSLQSLPAAKRPVFCCSSRMSKMMSLLWGSKCVHRYITIDELEATLKEYGMGDDATTKEVLSDVDSDNSSVR